MYLCSVKYLCSQAVRAVRARQLRPGLGQIRPLFSYNPFFLLVANRHSVSRVAPVDRAGNAD